MRHRALLIGFVALAACSSAPSGASRLTLKNSYWDRVNVEIVITRRADCGSHEEGFIENKEVVMRKDGTEWVDVPNGASVCWRHDRNPNNPVSGSWSGWTRATLSPGQSTQTEL